MGVDVSSLSIKDGMIEGGGKSMIYVEVVVGVMEWKLLKILELWFVKDYKYIG